MTYKIFAADMRPDGTVRVPKSIRQALRLSGKRATVGFVIQGNRILLTRTRTVPETPLTDKELAILARLSKRGAGKKTFKTTEAALQHLWSL